MTEAEVSHLPQRTDSDAPGTAEQYQAGHPGAAFATKAPVGSAILGPAAQGQVPAIIDRVFQAYAPLAYQLPWVTLDYIEMLATYNADYSQAVENIKTLANSGHNVFVRASSDLQQRKVSALIESKAKSIQSRDGGIDGLIDKLLDQAATFGAMCGEWLLSEDLTEVVDFADINPKFIRFFWDIQQQRYMPYQKVSNMQLSEARKNGQTVLNGCVQLNEATFHYFAFDAAPGSPYGTPPFLAALEPIGIQRDMIQNMSQIVKKIGLLGLVDVVVKSMPPKPGESAEDYMTRATGYLDKYAEAVQNMVRDGGLIHFDDVEVKPTSLAGNAAGATAIFKQNEELVFSGLKSMPSVQGRSYCVVPSTKVLTADLEWVPAGQLQLGDEVIGFDEDLGKGRGRGATTRMKRSTVEVNRRIWLDCVKVVTDKGEITVSKQHPLVALSRSAGRVWREAADLKIGDTLAWFGSSWDEDRSYDAGYLAGVLDGEGCVGRAGSGQNGQITMGQKPGVVLDETVLAMKRCGFDTYVGEPNSGDYKNVSTLRVLGGQYMTMRLLGSIRPHRLLAKAHQVWEGATMRRGGSTNKTAKQDAHATVTAIIDMGELEVVALQTSSRTFIAEGLLNHNSTTETYAGVAYDIIIRNTLSYQRGCKRMIEAGYWLMCTLAGLQPTSIELQFEENKTLNRLQQAQAHAIEIRNCITKWLIGVINQVEAAQELGYTEVAKPMAEPPPEALGEKPTGGPTTGVDPRAGSGDNSSGGNGNTNASARRDPFGDLDDDEAYEEFG